MYSCNAHALHACLCGRCQHRITLRTFYNTICFTALHWKFWWKYTQSSCLHSIVTRSASDLHYSLQLVLIMYRNARFPLFFLGYFQLSPNCSLFQVAERSNILPVISFLMEINWCRNFHELTPLSSTRTENIDHKFRGRTPSQGRICAWVTSGDYANSFDGPLVKKK